MLSRVCILLINIFFPPLGVLLLTGPYTDTLINCLLFLAGVLPSHVHAFYVSCTYYHRKSKVRKGKWPGGMKSFVYDKKVWNGGASDQVVQELWVRQEEKRRLKAEKKAEKKGWWKGSWRENASPESVVVSQKGKRYASSVGGSQRDKSYVTSGARGQEGVVDHKRRQINQGGWQRRTVIDEVGGRYSAP